MAGRAGRLDAIDYAVDTLLRELAVLDTLRDERVITQSRGAGMDAGLLNEASPDLSSGQAVGEAERAP